MAESPESEQTERQKHVAGFAFGVLLALLPIGAGLFLNPSGNVNFTAGRYELLLIGIFIGLSTGHYIGLAIGEKGDRNLYAAIGAFLTVVFAYIGLTYAGKGIAGVLGAGGVLFISTFLPITGHFSGIITDEERLEELLTFMAENASPKFLLFVWILEAIIPPLLAVLLPAVGLAEIGSAILDGLKFASAIVGVFVAFYIVNWWTSDMEPV